MHLRINYRVQVKNADCFLLREIFVKARSNCRNKDEILDYSVIWIDRFQKLRGDIR